MRLIKGLGIAAGYLQPGDKFHSVPAFPEVIYTVTNVLNDGVFYGVFCQAKDESGEWISIWDLNRVVYPAENVE